MDTVERLNLHVSSHGAIAAISRAAGLNRYTVKRIATGTTPNPGTKTIKAIERAMDDLYGPTPAPGGQPQPGQGPEE